MNTTLVKQIAAILYHDDHVFDDTMQRLASQFSSIDFKGKPVDFKFTTYYRDEMGTDLKRRWISFETLVPPDLLAEWKWTCRAIEMSMAQNDCRRINIDIGYLDLFKLVLASFKGRGNKILIGKQVWADMLLYFHRGAFHAFNWSFPDFQSGIYQSDLCAIRDRLRIQLAGQT